MKELSEKKRQKHFAPLLAGIGIALFLLYKMGNLFLPLDFSQEYRKIPNVENIVFGRSGRNDVFYKRCFWGLCKITPLESFETEQLKVILPPALEDRTDSQNRIWEAVVSPDGNYILYCEIDYDYYKSGLTDDEYCYYRIYNMNTEEIVTIYQAYKEWYHLDWQE